MVVGLSQLVHTLEPLGDHRGLRKHEQAIDQVLIKHRRMATPDDLAVLVDQERIRDARDVVIRRSADPDGVLDVVLLHIRFDFFSTLAGHADDDQARFRLARMQGIEVRHLAKARASMSAPELQQHDRATQVTELLIGDITKDERLAPGDIGSFRTNGLSRQQRRRQSQRDENWANTHVFSRGMQRQGTVAPSLHPVSARQPPMRKQCADSARAS